MKKERYKTRDIFEMLPLQSVQIDKNYLENRKNVCMIALTIYKIKVDL